MEYLNKYYNGIFWIPENSTNKIIGTLFVDKQGNCTINTLESLTKNSDTPLTERSWKELDIVLGNINCIESSDTYSLKLFNTFKTHETIGALNKFKYKSKNCLISARVDDEIEFNEYYAVFFCSELISKWIPNNGFNIDYGEGEEFKSKVDYLQPSELILFENSETKICIFFRAIASFSARRNFNIQESVFINIEKKHYTDLIQLEQNKIHIERFFSLLFFKPIESSVVEFKSISNQIYQSTSINNNKNVSLGINIDYNDFTLNSQSLINSWINIVDNFNLVIENYFLVYGQKGVLIENKLITYLSIIENIYKLKKINKDCGLVFVYKYFLTNSKIKPYIIDIKIYVERLKATRNYHTHLEEKHYSASLKGSEINKANLILEFVIREFLLQEIGFIDNEKIPQWIINQISNN